MSATPLPTGTVTFLFSDIEDSTELVRTLGNEAFDDVRGHHRRLLREAFRTHGGHEIDTAGDGFFVAFDSARDAVEAAIEGQLALRGFDWPGDGEVRVRMGLHTTEPLLGAEGYVGVGATRASRICDAGRGGQILVSKATAGIVEDAELAGVVVTDLGLHRLKGLHVPQRLFQVAAPGLESMFGPPRTPETMTQRPGTGTFLVADVTNWRRVITAVGDEEAAALTRDFHVRASAVVEAHSGTVLELVADTALAVFHSASDALRAAVAIRELVVEVDWPENIDVSVTLAVHSGRWSGNPQQPEAGTALSNLMQLFHSIQRGRTVVSATTAALVEGDRDAPSLRPLELSIGGEPATVFELVDES
jgi:class 3 adenylate cyclase